MAEGRLSPLRRLLALRHGLAARFTALFLVMALIVAVTGVFGIAKITLVGGAVQEMVRTRAAQEKMAVLMKVTVQQSRVHLLEVAMAFRETEDFDFAQDDYEVMRDRFRGYVALLLKGNAKVGIEAAPAGSTLEQKTHHRAGRLERFRSRRGQVDSAQGPVARGGEGGREREGREGEPERSAAERADPRGYLHRERQGRDGDRRPAGHRGRADERDPRAGGRRCSARRASRLSR